MSECVDEKGRKISQNVLRDTWRCHQIEDNYYGTTIFTCNLLTNSMCGLNDETNLNCDVNTNHFIKGIVGKKWLLNEIYIDNIRMKNSYLASKMNKKFIKNLVTMARLGYLIPNKQQTGRVYLPFCPHFFGLVHTCHELPKYFHVRYLSEDELNRQNHKLQYITSLADEKEVKTMYGTKIEDHEAHNTFTRRQIQSLCENGPIARDKLISLLNMLEDVEQVRYIKLSVRDSISHSLQTINNLPKVNCYSSYILRNRIELNFKSLHIKLRLKYHPLLELSRIVLHRLLTAIPNSKNGISITTEEPLNNGVMLNIGRPGVLRQAFGLSYTLPTVNPSIRAAYGHINGRLPIGADPKRYKVKPFGPELIFMSILIQNLLIANKDYYGLNGVNTNTMFNSCTVLLYHAIEGIKDYSAMGWHTDVKSNDRGEYRPNVNSQMVNTPTVVFTIGNDRYIHWREKVLHNNKSWEINTEWQLEMLLKHGNIFVLYPGDEISMLNNKLNKVTKYEHGKIKVIRDAVSVSFVFRVVTKFDSFSLDDNLVINHKEKVDTTKLKKRQELYKSVDVKK